MEAAKERSCISKTLSSKRFFSMFVGYLLPYLEINLFFFFSGVLELCQYCLIFGLKTQIISLNMNSPLKTKQFWSCFIARFVPVSVFNIEATLLQLLPSVYRTKLTDPAFCF